MKVLIIKLGALGDIITSTSVVKQIVEHHNKDEVFLLTSPSFENLFSNFEKLQVFSFKRKGLLNTIRSVLWIRKNKFDRIYDLQSNDRSSLYCALSGSPFRAGNHPRHPYQAHPKTKFIGECHSFERLNQIIESADIERAKALPYLPVPNNIVSEVNNWLDENKLSNKDFILLHAGSSALHLAKRWPYYSQLASALKNTYSVIWVGGNDEIELNKMLSKNTGINATNAFNILGLVELGKRAKFAVTNDSAPMHILSCAQIPVFGLFGPTYARRTHALGQFDNVITTNSFIAKNDADFVPVDISKISLDVVLNKIKEKGLM